MKMFYRIFSICLISLFTLTCSAQDEAQPAEPQPGEYLDGFQFYQIYLDQPIKKIQKVEYDKDGYKLKGTISEDQKKIYIEDYYKRGRVKFKVTYQDGTTEEFSKSSCFIDPVIDL